MYIGIYIGKIGIKSALGEYMVLEDVAVGKHTAQLHL